MADSFSNSDGMAERYSVAWRYEPRVDTATYLGTVADLGMVSDHDDVSA